MPASSKTARNRERKVERIETRVNREQKRRIEYAATLKGTTVSEFIIGSAEDAAARAIDAHEVWRLSGRDREIFVKALLRPPKPGARMRAAARRYKKSASGW